MTKKLIALISIFDNENFGTYLQIAAMVRVLQNKGYEVVVVNYVRTHLRFIPMLKSSVAKAKGPLGIVRAIVGTLKRYRVKMHHKKFVCGQVTVTQCYRSYSELTKRPPEADIYMTGSDQVWNSIYNHGIDQAYFCDFAPSGKKKVSYAASIGMEDFPENEKQRIKEMLSEYSTVTVREKAAKDILDRIGIVDSKVVLDPTLLLTPSDWEKIIPKQHYDEKYLLVYTVEGAEQDMVINHMTQKVAEEHELKIYVVSYKSIRAIKGDRYFPFASPTQFLSLVRDAEYMIVSSFHGTAFAINFNKQFLSVVPKRFSSRIDNILTLCGLTDRKIVGITDSLPEHDIDFKSVNQVLSIERKKSIHILSDMLK